MRHPPRLYNCARCAQQVVICSHCDRGQIYCAGDCAQQARKQSLQQAGQRYQMSRTGRLVHAARQARYRSRQQHKVTHQGSTPISRHDSLIQQLKRLFRGMESRFIQPDHHAEVTMPCHFCGRVGSPFVRWVFLSHFSSNLG
jgi:hypothetical protein